MYYVKKVLQLLAITAAAGDAVLVGIWLGEHVRW